MEMTRRMVVTERSQVAAARASARELARDAGFREEDEYRVGLVATELSTNLVKYGASTGELLTHVTGTAGGPVVELIALDRGRGIPDVALALSDGHSSSGSPGTGLGAVRRLSEHFDVQTTPETGTAVLARLTGGREVTRRSSAFRLGVVSVPFPGEVLCGDGWAVLDSEIEALIAVVDGLGHGAGAAEAAGAVLQVFNGTRSRGCDAVLGDMHLAARHTRGAAASVARLRRGADRLEFAGVGNVAGSIDTGTERRHLLTSNGTLGHQMRTVHTEAYPWMRDSMLVIATDGLSGRWSLAKYPDLVRHDPTLIAAVLYRDFARERDDVTVLVAQERV